MTNMHAQVFLMVVIGGGVAGLVLFEVPIPF